MSLRTFIGSAVFLAVLIAGFRALDAETAAVPEPGDLRAAGAVDCQVSCTPEVRSEFVRGVALLHSFFYEEARRIFTDVAAKDPTCAMAQWGIATTGWHPIWTPPTPDEMSAGKAAIEKAVGTAAGTERERGFIQALNVYYDSSDSHNAGAVGQSCHGPVVEGDRGVGNGEARGQLTERDPTD